MKRLGAKIKWFLLWGFIFCMIFGPVVGFGHEAHAIGQVAGHAWKLISTVFEATVGHLFGHHSVSVH